VADQPIAEMPASTFVHGQAVDSSETIEVTGSHGRTVRRPLYVDYFVPKS
jgi:hypothetical protein